MAVAVLLCGMYSGVCASAETGYEISLSRSVTPIGGEVVLTVALTNYGAQSDAIRGLQIDIDNVDADVLEVVSLRSLIVDGTAASNTPSHSQKNERVRLVYANFSGKLPVSDSADGRMDVFEVKFKVNGALSEDGQIELPVTVKLQTVSGQHTLKSSCTIAYGEQGESVYSVNISWTSMQFTYSDGEWNAESHEYGEGAWTVEENGGRITVENVGDSAISAQLTYSPGENFGNIRGDFYSGDGSVSELDLAVNEEKTVFFRLSGKPQGALTNAALGTIKITIGRSE